MIVLSIFGVVVLALAALALAALTAWSAWRAALELRQGFRSRPPGAIELALALGGVALPMLLIVLFSALLAAALLRMAL